MPKRIGWWIEHVANRGNFRFFRQRVNEICSHPYVDDQRKRLLQLPSGRSNWVEGTALIVSTRDDFIHFHSGASICWIKHWRH